MSHSFFSYRQTHDTLTMRLIANLGPLGVSIFFGISGYIITSLLVRERQRSGKIDLGAFYVRRAFRILPPFWVYLTAVLLFGPQLPWEHFRNAFAFLSNYLSSNWWLGHSWSLSVEEQFYLLWPTALALAWAGRVRIAVVLILLSPPLRVLTHIVYPAESLGMMFHTRIDALMVGVFIALTAGQKHSAWADRLLEVLRDGRVAALACIHLLLTSPLLAERFHGIYLYTVGMSSEAMAVGCIVVWAVHAPRGLAGRFLNWSPIQHVGLLSYSLYLWQQPFFSAELRDTWVGMFPMNWVGPLLLAELSYRVVERPALVLRDRVLRALRPVRVMPGADQAT